MTTLIKVDRYGTSHEGPHLRQRTKPAGGSNLFVVAFVPDHGWQWTDTVQTVGPFSSSVYAYLNATSGPALYRAGCLPPNYPLPAVVALWRWR